MTTVVLIEDAVSGLLVQKPNGSAGVWYDVSIVPNTLLNIGDATEETAGYYRGHPCATVICSLEGASKKGPEKGAMDSSLALCTGCH